MHRMGFEPGSAVWQHAILPFDHHFGSIIPKQLLHPYACLMAGLQYALFEILRGEGHKRIQIQE
jgi:hypothetical protein